MVADGLVLGIQRLGEIACVVVFIAHLAPVGVVHEGLATQAVVFDGFLIVLGIGVTRQIVQQIIAITGDPSRRGIDGVAVVADFDDFMHFPQSPPAFVVFQAVFDVTHSGPEVRRVGVGLFFIMYQLDQGLVFDFREFPGGLNGLQFSA